MHSLHLIFVAILLLLSSEIVSADQVSNLSVTETNSNINLTQPTVDTQPANGTYVTTDVPIDSQTEIDPIEYCNQTFQIRKGNERYEME